MRRIRLHMADAASPNGQSAQSKPVQATILRFDGGVTSEVPTFTQEGSASLAPLTLGDLQELRSSMAMEGFVIPEKRFKTIVEDVAGGLADGSVLDAIRQAQHWLVSSKANLSSGFQDGRIKPERRATR
ncbi:MAG: hypothetical protein NTW21_21480 [Verrucomicrobia bacterium]|nr:hypothetical protein [Verrucomicrobiota bacterium]